MAFKVQAPFAKFVNENAATPVAATFTEFSLESKRPGANPKRLDFYDRNNAVDAAPDTISWGGETEINIEYFAKEDTRNIQVGRNLNDDIPIEGKLLGKNAVFNANVMEAWRLTRDRLELTWNGLKYEVMIGKTSFKANDTFEVDFNVTFKVIRNLSFPEKPSLAITTFDVKNMIAALQSDVAELETLRGYLDLLTKKTILNSGLANDVFKFFGNIIAVAALAIESANNFIAEVQTLTDKAQRVINAPRQVLATLSSLFSKARFQSQRLINMVRGVGNFPGEVVKSAQQ